MTQDAKNIITQVESLPELIRSEFETLDQARKDIAAYIDAYHHRPHSGLRYRTPADVRQTWEDAQRLVKSAA